MYATYLYKEIRKSQKKSMESIRNIEIRMEVTVFEKILKEGS
jgi:hypothetical protein